MSKTKSTSELITAAPDLLAACKAIVGVDNPPAGTEGHIDFGRAIEMAKQAIAKARGSK